jgi:hypothetical protein
VHDEGKSDCRRRQRIEMTAPPPPTATTTSNNPNNARTHTPANTRDGERPSGSSGSG